VVNNRILDLALCIRQDFERGGARPGRGFELHRDGEGVADEDARRRGCFHAHGARRKC
jgi:hypothetical protein